MRLIDADELKKELREFLVKDNHVNNPPTTYLDVLDVVEEQTTYDIDKVVEEITKLRNDAYSYAFKYNDEFYDGQSDGLDKAIEIVNLHIE